MKSSSILTDVIFESDKTPLVLRLIAYIESLEKQNNVMQQVMEAYQTRITELEEKYAQLMIENKRLKKLPQKPKTTPSTMDKEDKNDDDKGSSNANGDKDGNTKKKNKNHKTRSKNKNLVIHETKIITIDHLPEGAFIKDYQTTIIQDIKFEIHNIELKLARYQLPDGTCITAEKPSYYQGQFGPTLKSFIDILHYDGRVTQGRIYSLLTSLGVSLSTGQVSHLLNHDRDEFHTEKADLLSTGLACSDYIQVDDTQAKHNGNNGYCLFIGNENFSFFESTDSKNRLNFLSCLNQKSISFVLNEAALAYCSHHKLPQKYLDRLRCERFDDLDAYLDYIASCGLTSEHHMRLMTEAALLDSFYDKGHLRNIKILSDDAGQFSISMNNALCWFHAERPLKKLVAVHPQNAQEIKICLDQFWQIYALLKAYKEAPNEDDRVVIETQFDQLCAVQTTSISLRSALGKLKSNRKKLLLVLDYPKLPLHNNLSENDIREYVMRRKISGSTRSEVGRMCRDTFVSLKKTCVKHGIRFWDFLIDRHMRHYTIPRLALLVKKKALACA